MEPRTPAGARKSSAQYGSDVVVEMLAALGIEYVALNPGASFRGLHDSLVNFHTPGAPQIITCTHEEICVALAHGYAKTKGTPMAAALHNLVGLQHGTMAIFNAWCDRTPILVLGGTGPMDASRRRPHIDWVHTALVQGNQVRDYVKIDDQPWSVEAVPESMLRAYKTATTQPGGPVYVCFDVELQEQKLTEALMLPDPARYAAPAAPGPNSDALAEAAGLLVRADWPVIIADDCGDQPATFAALQELAELLGCAVVDRGDFAFPSTHPQDLTTSTERALRDADVVLALNVYDLGTIAPVPHQRGGRHSFVPDDAKVIHITMSDYLQRSWSSDYEKLPAVDVLIGANVAQALPELLRVVRHELNAFPTSAAAAARRRPEVEKLHQEARGRAEERAKAEVDASPISAARLYGDLAQRTKGTPWAMSRLPRSFVDVTERGQTLGGGTRGGGLGYAYPAALGATLGRKGQDRLCIGITGDGDFLFTNSALWTAAHYNIPTLQIVLNNGTYYQDEGHQTYMARDRERPMDDLGNGIFLTEPVTNFKALADSFGVEGFGPVSDPKALGGVLDEAIKTVRSGRPALVDVVTQKAMRA